jgi:hypothetical protein
MNSLSRPFRTWLYLLAATGFALSGCSAGGKVSEEPARDLAMSAEKTTTSQSQATMTSLSGAERVDAYCDLAMAREEFEDEVDISNDFSPESAKRLADGLSEFIADAEAVIPAEIAADFELSKTAAVAFAEALEANDYDYFRALGSMDPGIVNDEGTEAASDRIEEFEVDVCGIVPDEELPADSDPVAVEPGMSDADAELIAGLLETEIGRELFIEGMMEDSTLTVEQATCFVDTADLKTLLTFSQDGSSENDVLVDLLSTLSDCDIDIGDLSS